jgi:hypothetical protein
MGILWEEHSVVPFLIITVILGGGAAWMSGRAIARGWKPAWRAALWMVPLGFAVRFIHFALGEGTLLSLHYLAVDTAVLVAFTLVSHRRTRSKQMVGQYPWRFVRAGWLGWRLRGERTAGTAG